MIQTARENIIKDIIRGVAITIVVFVVAVYMPFPGFLCSLFIPLPILYYRSKLGRKTGMIIPVAAIFIMIVMTGRVNIQIFFFFELLLLGFILGELIEMDVSIEKTFLYTCSVVMFAGVASLIFYSNISNTNIVSLVSEYVAKNIDFTMAMYRDMDVPEESMQMLSGLLESIHYVLIRIIPAMVIASTLFVIWANLLLARPVLRRQNLFCSDFGHLNLWKAPDFFVWGVIGAGVMLLFPVNTFKLLGLNALIIFMTVYFFAGIAVISFYFEKNRFPVIIRVFLYSIIALQQLIQILVVGLGFFDIWLNFRKLEIKKSSS